MREDTSMQRRWKEIELAKKITYLNDNPAVQVSLRSWKQIEGKCVGNIPKVNNITCYLGNIPGGKLVMMQS